MIDRLRIIIALTCFSPIEGGDANFRLIRHCCRPADRPPDCLPVLMRVNCFRHGLAFGNILRGERSRMDWIPYQVCRYLPRNLYIFSMLEFLNPHWNNYPPDYHLNPNQAYRPSISSFLAFIPCPVRQVLIVFTRLLPSPILCPHI